jgi:hypothetical protein
MAVTASAKANVSITDVPATGDFVGQSFPYAKAFKASLASGTNADQSDVYGVGVFDFTASNAQTVNVQSDLVTVTGTAFNAAEITTFAISVSAANANATVTVAPDNTNGFAAIFSGTGSIFKPGTTANNGFALYVAPNDPAYVVTASTNRLRITPSAHASTVTIVATGRSA